MPDDPIEDEPEELDPVDPEPDDPDPEPDPEPDAANPEPDPEPDPDPTEPTAQSRGDRRLQRLANENRELRERAARAEGASTAIGTLTSAEDRRRQQAEEERRLADMTPDERLEFLRQRDREQLRAEQARGQHAVLDRVDRSDFERLCEKFPQYDRIKDEVENRLRDLNARGQTVERKILARLIIGEMAEKRGAQVAGKQRAKGADAIRRETTRPASARSDAGGGRTRQPKTAADRLADVTF